MGSKEVDRQLLLNYLEGNCSRSQLLQIREYLHDETYRDSLDKFMQEEWEILNRQPFPPLPGMDDQFRKFRSAYITPKNRTPLRFIRRTAAIAAAALLVAVAIWLLLPRLSGPPTRAAAPQWLSWHNDPGHRREIVLPDSTRVFLGPAGTLRYGQNDDHNRLVQLEGEAYFTVKPDQRRPFTVVTGALSTRDIGTEFNIRYYPGEPMIAIAVASGKVQVLRAPAATTNTAAQPAATPPAAPLGTLVRGQLLQYDSLTQKSGITDLPDPSAIGAWRKGVLSFHRQRLKEITAEMERYYGVRFQYADPTKEDILITTLLDNRDLADALDIVSLTAGVHFIRQGTSIVVK